jgi:nitronate monooxygenase
MGVAVSNWRLARAVSMAGQMGVVSGTAIDLVLARRLQMGDAGGHLKRAFEAFPIPRIAESVWAKYFREEAKDRLEAFKSKPMPTLNPGRALQELIVLGNFVEVFLAKEGHKGPVGINLLEKIQLPNVASLYGAMLAGVDYVLMGAGIPRQIPKILNQLAAMEPATMKVDVQGALPGEEYLTHFDPNEFKPEKPADFKRPDFLAIISSSTLAVSLTRKAQVPVDGFIIEGPTAGGHNAPPRGAMQLTEQGEPIYGDKDVPDLQAIAEIGLPFWMAGSYGREGKLKEARELGAQGIQVGTAFAYCEESGLDDKMKHRVVHLSKEHKVNVFTDPRCSPTGFPFKVVQIPETLSNNEVYEQRNRICDLGYLRTMYRKDDGSIGYRCGSEPIEDFLAKGGDIDETKGRKCVCNGLLAAIDMGQARKDGTVEIPIVTSGDDVATVAQFLPEGASSYSANDVIQTLLRSNGVTP